MLDIKKLLTKIMQELSTQSREAGIIEMFAGATAPTGWLICDGAAVSRTDYAALFAVIGTTYGTGDGITTFNLPDMRGRFPLGVGNGTATGHVNHALASKGGNENLITPYHNHSVSITSGAGSAHRHGPSTTGESYLYVDASPGNAQFAINTSGTRYTVGYSAAGHFHGRGQTANESAHTHSVSGNTGYAGANGNATGANMPPYIGINFIICAGEETV